MLLSAEEQAVLASVERTLAAIQVSLADLLVQTPPGVTLTPEIVTGLHLYANRLAPVVEPPAPPWYPPLPPPAPAPPPVAAPRRRPRVRPVSEAARATTTWVDEWAVEDEWSLEGYLFRAGVIGSRKEVAV